MDNDKELENFLNDMYKEKDLYKVIVVGPTGNGKSQFCNFIQRDTTNSINEVSSSLNSCTQDPKSNFFKRNNVNYEFIDTAGNADSGNNDIQNLKKLIDYLKKKESIDYILLLLKYGERITNCSKDYIQTLGKIFTPAEFYTHLSVIFTKTPIKPKKKMKKKKDKLKEEVNVILKKSFNLELDQAIPEINVFFIDTEYNEIENTYDNKSQETIDIIMERIKLNVSNYGSIDTRNLDMVGDNVKIRLAEQQKQIEEFQKMLKQEEINRKNEEKRTQEIKEQLEKEQLDEEKREKLMRELEQKENEQKEKERRNEEQYRIQQRFYEENE